LLIVCSTGPWLGLLALIGSSVLFGAGVEVCGSLFVAALVLVPCAVAGYAGVRLLRGRLQNVDRLRWWVEYGSLCFGLLSLPGACITAHDVWTSPSPPPHQYLLSGVACYWAVCSLAGMASCILLSAHGEEYTTWREARDFSEHRANWEVVEEETGTDEPRPFGNLP
jgi:hypothetical protein